MRSLSLHHGPSTLLLSALGALLFTTLTGCHAGEAEGAKAPILPLKTLRLYESGVGYFERSGTPEGSHTSLPIPAAHLDDALKSLVVMQSGKQGQMHGVEFGSSITKGMARALAGLPVDVDAPLSYRAVLESLKGATIEITTRSAPKRTGRLVDVQSSVGRHSGASKEASNESREAADATRELPELTLLVLADDASLLRVNGTDVLSVRPTDHAIAGRLDSALDALSTHGARTQRLVRLLADSPGPITIGYVAETPLWRTTYRLVTGANGAATLQGWALLHNDTDEDWAHVKVDLVNGQPDSYLYPLAAPRYARRGLVHPTEELSTIPQLLDKTVDGIWGDHADATGESIELSGTGEGGGGSGFGYGAGHGMIGGHTSRAPTMRMGATTVAADEMRVAEATGTENGALFTYTLGEPLDLRAHGSALVPILARAVEAVPLTWFGSATVPGRMAVRFVNSTPQTLPGGPISFFANGGFAGEAALDRMKPGERRFLTYGVDLDVELVTLDARAVESVKSASFSEGRLLQKLVKTTTSSFKLENRSGAARSVYLSLAIDAAAKVTGSDRVDVDSAAKTPVAIFDAPARSTKERRVTSVEDLIDSTALDALTFDILDGLATQSDVDTTSKAVLAEAAFRQKELETTREAIAKSKAALAETEKDLGRLREHLKALGEKGPAAGANPLLTRILAGEDNLIAQRKRIDTLGGEIATRTKAVQRALEKLRA